MRSNDENRGRYNSRNLQQPKHNRTRQTFCLVNHEFEYLMVNKYACVIENQ